MFKRIALVVVSIPFSVGASCSITCTECVDLNPFCPGGPVSLALNEAICVMRIIHEAGAAEVDVTATIVNDTGCPVLLEDKRSVTVNGEDLQGPSLTGGYVQVVDPADEYVVTVSEPTRGVQDMTVDARPFEITSPNDGATVSLLGFTLNWSNPDAALKVIITLRQDVFDEVTETFEIEPDTGSKVFDQDDLVNFVTGGDIVIEVTRIFERDSINGFGTAKLTYERSATITVEPTSVTP